MANTDYLPTKDADLQSWTANFITVANDNLTEIKDILIKLV